MVAKDLQRRDEEMETVARAVASLKEVQLLSERDGKIVPTRAALRFNVLYF
ncbi:MAG TPA: hypothetical protein VKA53_04780 [Thermoanaerobaculia bacterium]|nr:hypothetical protein [Thermoanaerobaculia bacterium]